MVLNIVLAVSLVRVLTVGGISLANSVAVTVEASILLWIAQQRLAGSAGGRFRQLAARGMGAGACMAGVMVAIERSSKYCTKIPSYQEVTVL